MNYFLALVAAAIVLVFGLIWLNESQASRIKAEAQAESMIIRAQAESRLTSAQASAITMAAVTPMILIITTGFVGSIVGVALIIAAVKYVPNRPQVIETRTIVYLPSGSPRRELWQRLSSSRTRVIEHESTKGS